MASIILGYNHDIFISYRLKEKEGENGGRGDKETSDEVQRNGKRNPALYGKLRDAVPRSGS